MDRTLFLDHLNEVFEVEPGEITGDSPLQNISSWDSLTFLGLIAMIDEQYGLALGPKEMLACETVDELICLVDRDSSCKQAA